MLLKLSGGLVALRKLRLYELDIITFDDPGPFVYEYVNAKTGRVTKRVYRVDQWPEPPRPPTRPEHECEPESYEADLWHVYNTYQSALLQRTKQVEAEENYSHDIARYVVRHCPHFPWWLKVYYRLLNLFGLSQVKIPQDCIISPEDYTSVYRRVLIPEVETGDIERVLRDMFPGFIRGSTDPRGDGDSTEGQSEGGDGKTMGSANPAGVGA